MAKNNDVYSVIVPAQTPDFNKHIYSTIYGGSTGCSVTINGVAVSVGTSSSINIKIRTISGGNGCFLLGENKDVYLGSTSVN
jgi:hypothetical protein